MVSETFDKVISKDILGYIFFKELVNYQVSPWKKESTE